MTTAIRRSVVPQSPASVTSCRRGAPRRAAPTTSPGLCHLPNGAAAYEDLLWAATSTSHGSDPVHELGVALLARLDDEYRQIGGPVLGLDDPALMRDRLRTDSEPAVRRRQTRSSTTSTRCSTGPGWKRLDGSAASPRAACETVAVSAGGMAYYTAPSPDGNRDGTFFFNATDPSRGQGSAGPDQFHETIPGHHLQLALAQEFDLHPVLGELEVTAYGEGWGLYAERLADEMGSTAPRCNGLAWSRWTRSGRRLVVDTGIHAKGWTREQAIDFLSATPRRRRTPKPRSIDTSPTPVSHQLHDRPPRIDCLRADAVARLGNRFTIPSFHDTILHGGMTPLNELARRIDAWTGTTPS